MAYCDAPEAKRYMVLQMPPCFPLYERVLTELDFAPVTGVIRAAARVVAGMLSIDDQTENVARVVLAAVEVADGVRAGEVSRWLKMIAGLVCALPINQRALLYYDCCNRLGYDPAER